MNISYIGEYWRSSTGATNTLTFAYEVRHIGFTWLFDIPHRIESSRARSCRTAFRCDQAALDGNLPANQVTKNGTLSGLNWLNGQSLYIRWQDVNDTGNDAGLAVDNFWFERRSRANIPGLAICGRTGTARLWPANGFLANFCLIRSLNTCNDGHRARNLGTAVLLCEPDAGVRDSAWG